MNANIHTQFAFRIKLKCAFKMNLFTYVQYMIKNDGYECECEIDGCVYDINLCERILAQKFN